VAPMLKKNHAIGFVALRSSSAMKSSWFFRASGIAPLIQVD